MLLVSFQRVGTRTRPTSIFKTCNKGIGVSWEGKFPKWLIIWARSEWWWWKARLHSQFTINCKNEDNGADDVPLSTSVKACLHYLLRAGLNQHQHKTHRSATDHPLLWKLTNILVDKKEAIPRKSDVHSISFLWQRSTSSEKITGSNPWKKTLKNNKWITSLIVKIVGYNSHINYPILNPIWLSELWNETRKVNDHAFSDLIEYWA